MQRFKYFECVYSKWSLGSRGVNIPKFEPKYTEDDFIKVLGGDPKTVGYIAKLVGCSRSTAVTYLNTLKEKKIVSRMSIDDGNQFVWSLVEV